MEKKKRKKKKVRKERRTLSRGDVFYIKEKLGTIGKNGQIITEEAIAKYLDVTRLTVCRWASKLQELGFDVSRGRRGKRKKIDPKQQRL